MHKARIKKSRFITPRPCNTFTDYFNPAPMLLSQIQDMTDLPDVYGISADEGYMPGQIGYHLLHHNDLDEADVILLSCDEWRGQGSKARPGIADSVRYRLYQLYHWHSEVRIADAGNLRCGAQLSDSYAALSLVAREVMRAGKRLLVFGGSHDLTYPLYRALASEEHPMDITLIDPLLDFDQNSPMPAGHFLKELLTEVPNYVHQFNLIGFQSYFVNPTLLETIDKLRFDCFRLGKVQEKMEEVEPCIRSSSLVSFDMQAMAHAYSPASTLSVNGFTGQEACKLMQYTGMSTPNRVTGIFGFMGNDPMGLSAMQVSQMIWYFFDGVQKEKHEVPVSNRSGYNEFHIFCGEMDTIFLQSRNTGRWWMQMPDQHFIPCSYNDYLAASHNELPERWLRAQERL